jgi:hypothetical protein
VAQDPLPGYHMAVHCIFLQEKGQVRHEHRKGREGIIQWWERKVSCTTECL